jgi:opacity protein-like surface antigen
MKRKILLGLIAFGSTALASGILPVEAPKYFDGLYLGGGIGILHTVADVHNNTVETVNQSALRTIVSVIEANQLVTTTTITATGVNSWVSHLDGDLGNNDFAGQIFAGFGKTFNSMYAGIELYARYADVDIDTAQSTDFTSKMVVTEVTTLPPVSNQLPPTTTINSQARAFTSANLDSDYTYGGAIRLGLLTASQKTLFYISLGAETSKFSVNVNHNFSLTLLDPLPIIPVFQNQVTAPVTIPMPNYAYSYSYEDKEWAFVPGVGIETMLTDNISLRAQYSYADYGKITHKNPTVKAKGSSGPFVDTLPDTNTTITTTYGYDTLSTANDEIDPAHGLFTLDLTWHFNDI